MSITLVGELDPGQQLARYMDFAKYVALLETQELHFARVSELNDPWEGLVLRRGRTPVTANGEKVGHTVQINAELSPEDNRHSYVSCWSIFTDESNALWDLYVTSGRGVAVITDVSRLHAQLASHDHEVFCGPIAYERLMGRRNELTSTPERHLTKDICYRHEEEYRALLYEESEPAGVSAAVDPAALIHWVLVHPRAPLWFLKLVHDLTERYTGAGGPHVRPSLLGMGFGAVLEFVDHDPNM